jgi:hypothetical protein
LIQPSHRWPVSSLNAFSLRKLHYIPFRTMGAITDADRGRIDARIFSIVAQTMICQLLTF